MARLAAPAPATRRPSGHHFHVAGHEAERLHGTAKSGYEAAAARNPALPEVAAGRTRRVEAEPHHLVVALRGRRRAARRGAAEVRIGIRRRGHRGVQVDPRDRERVPDVAARPGVDLANGLPVDVLDVTESPGHLAPE